MAPTSRENAQNTGSQQSQGFTRVIPSLMGGHKQLLKLNEANYGLTLSKMAQGSQQLAQGLGGIYGQYAALSNQVQNQLTDIQKPGEQAIAQQFAQQNAASQQDLISRGLGNSSMLSAARNQNTLMATQALGSLNAQYAQTRAGYLSQIGMGGLSAQMQGAGMQADMSKSFVGDLSNYKFANTMGNLTGQFSRSSGSNQGTSQGASMDMMGGHYGGGMGGHNDIMNNDPNFSGDQPSAFTYGPVRPGKPEELGAAAMGGSSYYRIPAGPNDYAGSYGEDSGNGTYGGYASGAV